MAIYTFVRNHELVSSAPRQLRERVVSLYHIVIATRSDEEPASVEVALSQVFLYLLSLGARLRWHGRLCNTAIQQGRS